MTTPVNPKQRNHTKHPRYRRRALVATGGAGDDRLQGGPGDDALDGGPGLDALDGQLGTDSCVNGEQAQGCEQP
jgi:RTX calcium-binding nonapeptide repeat (4 copies)